MIADLILPFEWFTMVTEEDGAGDEDPKPTLPEDMAANMAANGPSGAAPAPQREEEDKIQDLALEQTVHFRSNTPPALGAQ